WRQWIWAAAVIVGALVGQHWGVVGVAASVILALGLNYFLMLNLSIRLTGLSWRSFAKAHEPALVLSLVSGSVLWVIASPIRRTGMSPFPVLLLASSILAAWLLFLVWLLPQRILGREGLWML